ncbi:MAG TPA: carboxypeptidase-like regulatory domain-containing protein, partial [Chloroflexota bacterium]
MNVWGRRISGKLMAALAALALLVFASIVALSGSLTGIHGLGAHQAAAAPACASKFSVSPAAASAGSQITIQGSAWPAGKSLGVYLVDPTHKLRPTTLQLLTIPQSGAWKTTVTAPGSVTFHAVGDETTGNGAPQTFNQVFAPGRYLIYASAGDAASFNAKTVCPVQFTLIAASSAANSNASLPSSGGFAASAASLDASRSAAAPSSSDSTMPVLGGGLFLALLIALFYTLTRGRGRATRMSLGGRRKPFAVISGALGLLLIATSFVPLTGLVTGLGTAHAAAAGTTLYSDDFEADTLGALPAGWTVEVGSNWSVQLNGTQALEQTNSSATPLYGIYAGSPTWTDYSLSASVQPGPGSTTANTSVVAIDGRRQDVNNFYSLLVKNGNQWYLGKKVAGTWSTLAYGSISYNTTAWYTFTLTMTGSTISASINGTTLATVTDTAFTAGNIGFKTHNQTAYDNVVVTATGAGAPTPTPTTGPAATATSTIPAATATATPFGSGSISGQVTDSGSGTPIVNAQVSTVPASITATTDSNGNYTLANVSSGSYDVVFTATGYNENHVANITVTNGAALTASGALQGVPGYTAMDIYTQPNQSGWNPSTDGNTWADDASVYPGASVSIQNNQGYVDTYTAATDRDEWMSVNYASQLVSADFNVLQFGQDSYQHGARLLGRVQDGHH